MIQRPADRPPSYSTGQSFGIARFLLLVVAVVLAGCGAEEKADSPGPPEIYPGVLDLPAATASGFLRCSPGGPDPSQPPDLLQAPGPGGTPGGASEVTLGPAPLSREFVDGYRLRPPWEPEMPSFLPVDPGEHDRWMQLMELRSRFLFRRDPATGGWRPDAATSAELDVAEATLTVRLREDLVWSDGTPASAADWVITVEEVYQLPGVQSPLKELTESGGAVWRALDDTTIEVAFESIPPDPLSILGVPPLPVGDPRVASLAQGYIDVLFDLEAAKAELPTLRRPGETESSADWIPALADPHHHGSLLASTGAGNRGLVLVASREFRVSGVFEEFLEVVRRPVAGGGLLLLPWEGPPMSGGPGSSDDERDGTNDLPDPQAPSGVRIAYSFASPGARGAALLLASLVEERGDEEIAVVPENAQVLDSVLPDFLSGGRPLPGDAVLIEVSVDHRYSIPLSIYDRIAGAQGDFCGADNADNIDEWYNCIESVIAERMGALSAGAVRLVPLGRLPRLLMVAPGTCFTEPVPYGARGIDLGSISEATEEEES